MSDQEDRERVIRQRLKDNFPHYAAKCLKIRPKKGGLIPFELNDVQLQIHEALERQLAETGRVRMLILKMRQPGCSTYVEGRYYWKVTHRKGVRAFILTHGQDATDNLFGMVDRFNENCPALVHPQPGKSNAKELTFPALDSGYRVGTAGTIGVGRSETIQFFHGSEVAQWQNADSHMAGVLQAVPEEDGTEIILESTAHGLEGLFYEMCKVALHGESEYGLIFIPWFSHSEYRKKPPKGWKAPEEFQEYGEAYGLDPDQLYWAYTKNQSLAQSIKADGDKICWVFRQEYPATAIEAFQTGSDESFIKSELVYKARKNTVKPDESLPIVIGVDIARGGKDKTRLIDRQGRKAGGHLNVTLNTDDLMVIAGRVAKEIDRIHATRAFLDVTGLGAGVYDRLGELGYAGGYDAVVTGINFAQKPIDDRTYSNKRAEMWGECGDWLGDPAGVDIPDDDDLHADLCAPVWGKGATRFNSNEQIVLEPKDHIKGRLGRSPDGGDALALTFAEPVSSRATQARWDRKLEEFYEEDARPLDSVHALSRKNRRIGGIFPLPSD